MNPLPDLTTTSCEACGGDGYTLLVSGSAGDGLPTERRAPCGVCGGTGDLEVCSGCLRVPEVTDGLETCGCVAETLRQAA